MSGGVRLETLEENQASRAFYERHGLAVGGRGINPVNGLPTVSYCWRPARRG
jgi:RimJ/RimL family protein N-acetyltransferase